MNRELEDRIVEAATLPEVEQERLAVLMGDYIAGVTDTTNFENDMKDPDYREYVESSVAAGVADLKAGRVFSSTEIRARLAERLNQQNG